MLTQDQKNQNSINFFLNTYFNVILTVVFLIILTVVFVVFIRPKYQDLVLTIKINNEQQQRLLTEQQKKLKSLQTISELYKKIPATDLDKFNKVLPDKYIKERLFGELGEIINQEGFVLNSISLSESELGQDDLAGKVNLELSISAIDYRGLKRLLRVLETNLRLFDVSNLNFSPAGNSVDLSLTTYYYQK